MKYTKHVKTFHVPIYRIDFMLIITNDINRTRKEYEDIFGEYTGNPIDALCSWSPEEYIFALIIKKDKIGHGLIAHEVFHCVHRMMETMGDEFSKESHEPYAYLCGWVTSKIYKTIHKLKFRITQW